MKNIDLISNAWEDYELLDSGNNRKLERFGKCILIRPETQAIWLPKKEKEWSRAQAEFMFEKSKGRWVGSNIPQEWEIAWGDVRFLLKPTAFKHVGVFPEQSVNWKWIQEKVSKLKNPKILNLFGYTGIASVIAAQNGADVTHVDSSKQSNAWARENASLSGVSEKTIKYILEDVRKYVERESRRGSRYDGIILDPPAFGRGVKKEVWKIEEDLRYLLKSLGDVLSKKESSFFLLNGYAAGYSPISFFQSVEDIFPQYEGEYGEIGIKESGSQRMIPSGIYLRFQI